MTEYQLAQIIAERIQCAMKLYHTGSCRPRYTAPTDATITVWSKSNCLVAQFRIFDGKVAIYNFSDPINLYKDVNIYTVDDPTLIDRIQCALILVAVCQKERCWRDG